MLWAWDRIFPVLLGGFLWNDLLPPQGPLEPNLELGWGRGADGLKVSVKSEGATPKRDLG